MNLSSVMIPDSITHIEQGTFTNCRSLQEAYIPESVERIHKYAFTNCNSLKQVSISKEIIVDEAAFDVDTEITLF